MNEPRANVKTGLVLPGGGARGAFQVGVLKAVAELLPRGKRNPFPIISGTSAGAVNSVVLATRAHNFRSAVAELERVWGHFRCKQVYKTDHFTMLKSSLHWIAALAFGGLLVGMPKTLLDNTPLRKLLSHNVHFPRIRDAIEAGHLDAVSITAAGYSSARSISFFAAGLGTDPQAGSSDRARARAPDGQYCRTVRFSSGPNRRGVVWRRRHAPGDAAEPGGAPGS
jgi:NTE family protein